MLDRVVPVRLLATLAKWIPESDRREIARALFKEAAALAGQRLRRARIVVRRARTQSQFWWH